MHEMLTVVTDVHSVCLLVCLSCGGGACSVHHVPCVRGDLVQPSPNAFGLSLLLHTCTVSN